MRIPADFAILRFMQLLGSFSPIDADPNAAVLNSAEYAVRRAGRGIIFDQEKIALLYIGKHGYYMLPGGGTNQESTRSALIREALEEIGCDITIEQCIGSIEIYLQRWQTKQTDTCYIAHVTGKTKAAAPTAFERTEKHRVTWTPSLAAAIALMDQAIPENMDGKLIRLRDLLFLRSAGIFLGMSGL
jgi:8-oxo-dGTP diphosphatase